MNINKKNVFNQVLEVDMANEQTDQGFMLVFKDSYIKKRKRKLKKYCICVFGETKDELIINFEKIKNTGDF